jgi:hypothetical protein
MPSLGGVKDAMIDYAVGLGGGLVYALSTAITGSGLIGGLVGAGIAGSVVKGTRGTAIATILGFMTLAGSIGSASASQSDAGVM